jgi:hypothetical protein
MVRRFETAGWRMKRLRIGVVDLVTKGPTRSLYARLMNANQASIMPQVVAAWCQAAGHEVTFVCYTGFEDLEAELPRDVDLVFIGAFTEAAMLAYALSNIFRSRGAVTVLGGPHARCYPEDAVRYFDYVLGFTDRQLIREVLSDCSPHQPVGLAMSAASQPNQLASVRERWPFIEATVRKAPFIKGVPMLASLGCPYTCSFCIDASVPYQPLDFEALQEDIKFLRTKFKRPLVAWHDPNFGIRFDETMEAIEAAAPSRGIEFGAESSLSILAPARVQRLRRNGCLAILPGVESWYDLGNKSKTGTHRGIEKVRQVSEQVNSILSEVPYVQTNFVLGLDGDAGAEPFELTKKFIDLTPGAFPGYSLLSAFGRAAPLNLELQRDRRVLPFPFHFLDNNRAMNVKPKNYSWPEIYDRVIDLTKYTFSWPRIARRFRANRDSLSRWMNVVRAISSEGFGRIRYYTEVRRRLDTDRPFRRFFEQETTELPEFYRAQVERDLGPFWEWLPAGALTHDQNAYLAAQARSAATPSGMPLTPIQPPAVRAGAHRS